MSERVVLTSFQPFGECHVDPGEIGAIKRPRSLAVAGRMPGFGERLSPLDPAGRAASVSRSVAEFPQNTNT